ncbi:MAG TPA: response regulator [Ktedonobacterales bacterium]
MGTVVNRALVVDDDDAIRETLRSLLEDAGYAVEEASEGMEALRYLRMCRDRMVVLLDLMMPGLDGAGVLGAVAGDRKLAQQFAFILITANHNTLTLALANLLKNLDVPFVSKPFDVDHLVGVVDAAARRLAR